MSKFKKQLMTKNELLLKISLQEKEIVSLREEISKLKNDNFPVKEILALMPGNIFWKDRNGKLLGCNNNNAKFFGYSSHDEMIGLYSKDFMPQDFAKLVDKNDQEIMESGQGKFLEETGLDIHNQPAFYFTQKTPLYDETGQVKGLLGIAIDITERKKIETELKLAKEKAEAASRAKSQFLAVMNHELRTPLTSIIGLTSFLKQGELSEVEQKNTIIDLENCALYLLTLVNDILDFSKLEANKMKLSMYPVNLDELIQEVIQILARQAKNKGLALQVKITPEIPTLILSDAKILRQILVNIIGNAIKFTEKGFVNVELKVIEKNQNTVKTEIIVTDSGCGIPADKLEVIFEPFQQLEDIYIRQSSRTGTGLGLAIVKKLLELLGMTVDVETEQEKGSIFTLGGEFEIPKLKNINDMDNQKNDASQIQYFNSGIKPKVLLVEDDLIVQRIHKSMLMKLGCEVDVATHGLEALNMLKDHDILFVDIGLSDITGFEVIQNVRKKNGLPIIALTGYTGEEERKKCIEVGANKVIDKPVSLERLQTILLTHLQ